MEATTTEKEAAVGLDSGRVMTYVFVGLYDGVTDKVQVFGTMDEAKTEYKSYTGFEYPAEETVGGDMDHSQEHWSGTDIFPQNLRIRDCEGPDCLGFIIASKPEQEFYLCEVHESVLAERLNEEDLPAKVETDRMDLTAGSYDPGAPEDEEDLDFDLNDVVAAENRAAEEDPRLRRNLNAFHTPGEEEDAEDDEVNDIDEEQDEAPVSLGPETPGAGEVA